jgi:hypothetical protein
MVAARLYQMVFWVRTRWCVGGRDWGAGDGRRRGFWLTGNMCVLTVAVDGVRASCTPFFDAVVLGHAARFCVSGATCGTQCRLVPTLLQVRRSRVSASAMDSSTVAAAGSVDYAASSSISRVPWKRD